MSEFGEINDVLDKCCQLALSQPLPDKQLFLMTGAVSQAAGYAVLTEAGTQSKFTSTPKTYAPEAYGFKMFTLSQIKMCIYAKNFLAIYLAFKEFGLIFWGQPKPVIIMINRKTVTNFFSNQNDPNSIME